MGGELDVGGRLDVVDRLDLGGGLNTSRGLDVGGRLDIGGRFDLDHWKPMSARVHNQERSSYADEIHSRRLSEEERMGASVHMLQGRYGARIVKVQSFLRSSCPSQKAGGFRKDWRPDQSGS